MAQPVRTPSRGPQQRPRSAQHPQARATRNVRTVKGSSAVHPFKMPFEQKNMMYILIGIGTITLGYILMGMSETMGFMALDVSPIILLLGYLAVIPFGIMYGAHRRKVVEVQTEEAPVVI
jgi:hypothetical protein